MIQSQEHATKFRARALGAIRGLAVAAALVAGVAAQASAQVTFAATTQFAFNGGGLGNTATYHGLTFNSGSFTVTTLFPGDDQGIGGAGNSFGTASLNLQPGGFNFGAGSGTSVQMAVTFSVPTVSGAQNFTAAVTGQIFSANNGVLIKWNPSSLSNIPFTSGAASGLFDLTVNNISVNDGPVGVGTPQNISGDLQEIATTGTPEPASLALVATGLVGMFGVARRRRSKS